MNTNFELPANLFANDGEFRIPNDENEDINFDLIMEPVTPEHPEKINTLERALAEVDKYLQSLDENDENSHDQVINGPNVHDCYKHLEIKVPLDLETQVRIDSPRPGNTKRFSDICKIHNLG